MASPGALRIVAEMFNINFSLRELPWGALCCAQAGTASGVLLPLRYSRERFATGMASECRQGCTVATARVL